MKYCPTCNASVDEDLPTCPRDGTALVAPSSVGTRITEGPPTDDDADDDDASSEVDLSGRTIAARYRILKRLGEGGMGVVYAAVDERLDKKVAIKVLREDFAHRTDVVARFTQEARSAARIKHENILDVTDYGTDGGSFYITMELLVGTDLAEVLEQHTTLDQHRGLDIALQICRALAAAHGKGIVHRDLKPENVFLVRADDGREVVKIVDFGIAQMKDLTDTGSTTSPRAGQKKLTRTGMIFGTPEYMSPEQAAGKTIDHRVDVYAVGIILYEIFAGRVPFMGENFMGVLSKHMFEAVPPIREVNPGATLSPELEAVIHKALAKEPRDRFASMTELVEVLGHIRQGDRPSAVAAALAPATPPEAPRPSATPRAPASTSVETQTAGVSRTIEVQSPRSHRRVVVSAATAVVVMGIVAVAAFGTERPPAHDARPPTLVRPRDPAPIAPPTVPEQTGAHREDPPAAPAVAPTVRLRILTGERVATVTATRDGGEALRCEQTPCEREVPAGVPLHLVATSARHHGTLDLVPAGAQQDAVIPMTAVEPAGRPGRNPESPRHGHATPSSPPRRCGPGVTNSDGLLVPCIGEDSP